MNHPVEGVNVVNVYLDNQASTPMDERVVEAMREVGYGNPHSSEHSVGWEALARVYAAREQVAALIGADADEIFFTSGATEANNLAVLGVRKLARVGKNHVITSAVEHKSVLASCDALSEEYGFEIDTAGVDAEGVVSAATVARMINDRTALVSIAMVNNEIGVIQDIVAIRQATSGTLLHCDAAQAPEAVNMSESAARCDMLSLSGHKMRGPMGIGALYISRRAQPFIAPILFGGGQQNGIRPGTLPLHLCVGMGAACALSADNAGDRARVAELRDKLVQRLSGLGLEFETNGPSDPRRRHPGNINIRMQGADADQLIAMLQPRLSISTGSACTSGTLEPSYVLTAIGLSHEEASSSIRISVGATTKERDIMDAAEMIVGARAKLV